MLQARFAYVSVTMIVMTAIASAQQSPPDTALSRAAQCGFGLGDCLSDTDDSHARCEAGCRRLPKRDRGVCRDQCARMFNRDFCYRRHCRVLP